MSAARLSGTGVALVTPFKDGAVHFSALENIIEHVIKGGIDYLVSLGTTGEAVTLKKTECLDVLRFTVEKAAGRLPVIAGFFGHNHTASLVNKIKTFNFDGIDYIMSSSPSYNKPPQEGIYQHYMRIADASPRPIIIYNVPGRTASNLTAETTLRLAHASENFAAVKEASADMVQAMQILKDRPEHFSVLSGDDPTALPLVLCGGDGCISVIANAFPKLFSDMIRAALQGDLPQARALNAQMLDIHPWLYIDGNPAGIKSALSMIGLCSKEVRLPLVEMSAENFEHLREALGW